MNLRSRLQQLSAAAEGHLKHFEVDLGNKVEPYVPMIASSEVKKPRVEYPCLYIYGRKDKGIFDLPASGKAIVKYRIRSKTVRTDEDGTDRFSSDIEVHSIDPVKKGAKGSTDLQAIIASYDLADGRARDGGGRYAAGAAAPSPQDIADAQGATRRKRKAVAIGAAGLATVAAGALPVTRKGAARLGGGALRTIAGLR